MFYSVYSRMAKKGDGNGGYITYVSGDDREISKISDHVGEGTLWSTVEILVDEGYKFAYRTNPYHEMLEVSVSKPAGRWQDSQVLQVVGSSPRLCLCDCLALLYLFFYARGDWLFIAEEIEGQELGVEDANLENLPANLRFEAKEVESPQPARKGGKKTITHEDDIAF